MATRNVNKVLLIGNLTRDPEIRYTPQSTAVANFTVATNRSWVVDGVEKEAVDFHNVVAWGKLGEICGQLLQKGSKVYVEGRLQTRSWDDPSDGSKKYKTEVNIEEMILLGRGKDSDVEGERSTAPASAQATASEEAPASADIDLDALLEEIDGEQN